MVSVSKIDKYQLGPEVRKLNMEFPGKPGTIAKKINEKYASEGISINRVNVSTWIKNACLPRDQDEAIVEMSKELVAKDQDEAIAYHNEMFEAERKAIRAILEKDEVPEHVKLNQIQKVYNGSLGRTLDSFGYGRQNNVNIQNNVVILDQTIDKIIDVLESKLNGESSEIISELRSVIRSSVQ